MKSIGVLFMLLALIGISCIAQTNTSPTIGLFQNSTLPKGNRAPESYFTGTVWLYPITNDSLAHWSIAKVTFEPNAHSNWHTHRGKQVLVITDGIGYLKEKGKPIQVLHKGDVVTIQPGVKHWHGATPQNGFVQIVINPDIKDGVVVDWLERVTDEEYQSGK